MRLNYENTLIKQYLAFRSCYAVNAFADFCGFTWQIHHARIAWKWPL